MRDDNFSLKRFGLYARADLVGSGKLYLLIMIAYFLIINTIYYIFYLIADTNRDMEFFAKSSKLAAPEMVSFAVSSIAVSFFVSLGFYYFLNRNYAVATMMIPTSKSEKFTYTLLFNLVLTPAVALVLVTLAHLIWSWIYGVEFVSVKFPSWRAFVDVSLMTLMMLSLFFYGAIRFRRLNFVLTLILLVIIWVVIYNSAIIINYHFIITNTALDLIFLVISLAMVLLSWYRFRKLQITK